MKKFLIFSLVILALVLSITPVMGAGMSVATNPIALLNGHYTISYELNTSEKNTIYAYLLRVPEYFMTETDFGYRWYFGKAQNGFYGELAGGYLFVNEGEHSDDSGLLITGMAGYKKTFKWGLTLDGGLGIMLAPGRQYWITPALVMEMGYGW